MLLDNIKEILGYISLFLSIGVIIIGVAVAIYEITKWKRMMKEHEEWEKEFKKEWDKENLK